MAKPRPAGLPALELSSRKADPSNEGLFIALVAAGRADA
jgi:hypothetical protein